MFRHLDKLAVAERGNEFGVRVGKGNRKKVVQQRGRFVGTCHGVRVFHNTHGCLLAAFQACPDCISAAVLVPDEYNAPERLVGFREIVRDVFLSSEPSFSESPPDRAIQDCLVSNTSLFDVASPTGTDI